MARKKDSWLEKIVLVEGIQSASGEVWSSDNPVCDLHADPDIKD